MFFNLNKLVLNNQTLKVIVNDLKFNVFLFLKGTEDVISSDIAFVVLINF